MKNGLANSHAGDEFRTPDATAGSRNADLLRETRVHMHDIGHECERGKLVAEGTSEEPEVGKGREGGAEVVLDDCRWHVLFLYGSEGFEADAISVIEVLLLRLG